MKSHTFHGRRWRIVFRRWADRWGSTDPPTRTNKTIYLDPGPVTRLSIPREVPHGAEELYIALHEATHATDFNLDESVVIERAADMTRWLWRLGYRKREGGIHAQMAS